MVDQFSGSEWFFRRFEQCHWPNWLRLVYLHSSSSFYRMSFAAGHERDSELVTQYHWSITPRPLKRFIPSSPSIINALIVIASCSLHLASMSWAVNLRHCPSCQWSSIASMSLTRSTGDVVNQRYVSGTQGNDRPHDCNRYLYETRRVREGGE